MNCKPGIIAICTSENPRYKGRRFFIIAPAPLVEFLLPDGTLHAGSQPDSWIVQPLGGPIDAFFNAARIGAGRPVYFGVGRDEYLRPATAAELA